MPDTLDTIDFNPKTVANAALSIIKLEEDKVALDGPAAYKVIDKLEEKAFHPPHAEPAIMKEDGRAFSAAATRTLSTRSASPSPRAVPGDV